MTTWRQTGPASYVTNDQELRVRLARPQDLFELKSVDIEVFGDLAYQFFVLRQLFDVHRDCWLVAEHSTGLQGYSLCVPTLDRATGWILGLAVRPAFRGTGCGRMLTAASLRTLRSRNVRDARLTVDPDNEPAVALYRKIGFITQEYLPDYFGAGQHRLLMVKKLSRSARQGSGSEDSHNNV